MPWPLMSFGDEQSRLQREPRCAAWASAKPYGSPMLILSWLEGGLASSAPRAFWPVLCSSSGPQLLTAALGLSGAGKAGWWLLRMLAVREIALGTGTVAASRPNADPWPWLMTVSAIDGAEALVLLVALRRKAVDGPGGWAFAAADAGSAAALITRIAHLGNAG
jgi:hypothetical protein